jgi:hypothetical protein
VPDQIITTAPEQIHFREGVVTVQVLGRPRLVRSDPWPGPRPRVQAAPPAPGRGSKPRR